MDADGPQMRPSSDADGPHMGPSRDADGPGLAASGRGGGGAVAGTDDDPNKRDSERSDSERSDSERSDSERSDSDGVYHDDDPIKLSHKRDTHGRGGSGVEEEGRSGDAEDGGSHEGGGPMPATTCSAATTGQRSEHGKHAPCLHGDGQNGETRRLEQDDGCDACEGGSFSVGSAGISDEEVDSQGTPPFTDTDDPEMRPSRGVDGPHMRPSSSQGTPPLTDSDAEELMRHALSGRRSSDADGPHMRPDGPHMRPSSDADGPGNNRPLAHEELMLPAAAAGYIFIYIYLSIYIYIQIYICLYVYI